MALLQRRGHAIRVSAGNFWRHTELPSVVERYFTRIRYVELEINRYFGHYLRAKTRHVFISFHPFHP